MIKQKIRGKRIGLFIILSVLFIALSLQTSSAFGVFPAKHTKFFDYGKVYIYSFWVINKEQNNISLDISVEGELSKYITILNKSIDFKETDDLKGVYFRVDYPPTIQPPGSHTANIIFTESGRQNGLMSGRQEGNKIRVVPVIKAVFEAFAPYPGTYLEYNMSIKSANSKQPVKIIFPLSNKGTEDISDIYADVDIFDWSGKPIALKKTQNMSIESQKQSELRVIFDSMLLGSYKAKAVLHYGGDSATFEQEFDYGKWVISIKDIRVEDFTLGDFVEFDITLQNNWNEDAVDVIADLIVTDVGLYKYQSVTSFTTIPAQESGHIKAYWDTHDATPGDYYLNMDVHYANHKEHYVEKVTIEDKRIITKYYTPPEPLESKVLNWYKKILPEKYMPIIKNMAYSVLILIMCALLFLLLVQLLPFVSSTINKINLGRSVHAISALFARCADSISNLDSIEFLRRKKKIKELRVLKRKYAHAIESARDDLLVMKKAVHGLYSELSKGTINKKEFDKRLLTILEEKPIIWWEDHYAKLMIKLEDKIKEINKKIWEDG